MPLQFEPPNDRPYFTTKFVGKVTDEEILAYYKGIYSRPEIEPPVAEFADLSEGDLSGLTSTALVLVAQVVEEQMTTYGYETQRTAIYAPERVLYGMGRAYEAWAGSTSEDVRVFDNREEALAWLCN